MRLIGDDQQLASPAAGGALKNIATDVGALTLSDVVRFSTPGEAEASLAVRAGQREALGFYLDTDRVWVGNETSLADGVFTQWQQATARGREALMMAHSNDTVTDLNARARDARLSMSSEAVGASVALRSGLEASTGDIIVTRKNNRRLAISTNDFVKNGDRWHITAVHEDGSLRVQHNTHGAFVNLPAEYVRTQVDLGYASTFHGAQGQTVDEGLALLNGTEDRQLFYVGMTRGRHNNRAFVPTGGDGDEHTSIAPEALRPATSVEILEGIIARDGSVVSATTTLRDEHDPRRLLAQSVARYEDALDHAASRVLGDSAMAELAAQAETIVPGVTDAPAWDTLHAHLAYLALDDIDPFTALRAAVNEHDMAGARDIAAVLDWRLDSTATPSADTGPLPWLAGIPTNLAEHPTYGPWLRERHELVTTDALSVRAQAAAFEGADVPEWARAFTDTEQLHGDLAIWRAATNTPDDEPSVVGKTRLSVRQRTYQDALNTRAERHAPTRDGAGAMFSAYIDHLAPRVLTDEWWPVLARRLDAAQAGGRDVAALVTDVLEGGKPLPDEHAAAALWSRLVPHLGSAGAHEASHLAATSGRLRPPWTRHLETAWGDDLAAMIVTDAAWPALVEHVTTTAHDSGLSDEQVITAAINLMGTHRLPTPRGRHRRGRADRALGPGRTDPRDDVARQRRHRTRDRSRTEHQPRRSLRRRPRSVRCATGRRTRQRAAPQRARTGPHRSEAGLPRRRETRRGRVGADVHHERNAHAGTVAGRARLLPRQLPRLGRGQLRHLTFRHRPVRHPLRDRVRADEREQPLERA